MAPEDIVREVRRRPFEPFCLVLDDGTGHIVRNPFGCLVTQAHIVLGVSGDSDPLLYEEVLRIDPQRIVRIESLATL